MCIFRAPIATMPSRVGLRMLTLRHFVLEEDGSYRANPKELILLRYYANSIAHSFPSFRGASKASEPEIHNPCIAVMHGTRFHAGGCP